MDRPRSDSTSDPLLALGVFERRSLGPGFTRMCTIASGDAPNRRQETRSALARPNYKDIAEAQRSTGSSSLFRGMSGDSGLEGYNRLFLRKMKREEEPVMFSIGRNATPPIA